MNLKDVILELNTEKQDWEHDRPQQETEGIELKLVQTQNIERGDHYEWGTCVYDVINIEDGNSIGLVFGVLALHSYDESHWVGDVKHKLDFTECERKEVTAVTYVEVRK